MVRAQTRTAIREAPVPFCQAPLGPTEDYKGKTEPASTPQHRPFFCDFASRPAEFEIGNRNPISELYLEHRDNRDRAGPARPMGAFKIE